MSRSNTAGRRSIRSIRRHRPPIWFDARSRDCHAGCSSRGLARESCDHDDSDRVHDRRRPGPAGLVSSLADRAATSRALQFGYRGSLGPKRLELLAARSCRQRRRSRCSSTQRSGSDSLSGTGGCRQRRASSGSRSTCCSRAPRAISTRVRTLAHGIARRALVSADPFFNSRRVRLSRWRRATRLPAIYPIREYAVAGGLM